MNVFEAAAGRQSTIKELARVFGKSLNVPTPHARELLAKTLGISTTSNDKHRTTVRIEAAGSGTVLVPALPLPEGKTCAHVKEDIAIKFEGCSFCSFELMMGHGGHILNDEDIIPPGTDILVLMRSIPSVTFDLENFNIETIQFVVDGKTFTVGLAGFANQIDGLEWEIDGKIRPVNFEIEHEGKIITETDCYGNYYTPFGEYSLFVGASIDGDRVKFTLFKYKFDDETDIGNNVDENWNFQTKGTINGQEVTLSQCMECDGGRFGDLFRPQGSPSIQCADGSNPFEDCFLVEYPSNCDCGDCGGCDIVVNFLEIGFFRLNTHLDAV